MQSDSTAHILVIGANGQLGTDMVTRLEPGFKVSKSQLHGELALDLSRPETLREAILKLSPDLIINCAAYTAVDKAESEPLLAQAINGESPQVLAACCKELGIRFIHYSTDYVYDGNFESPITEDATPNPLNEYGRSKLYGDNAIVESGCEYNIFRTSWVYAAHGHNFLRTMLRLGQERDELRIVDDQIGSPTWTGYLANETSRIVKHLLTEKHAYASGIYHLTCGGETSWHGFAEEIFNTAKSLSIISKIPKLLAVPSEEYPTPAQRPRYSVLNSQKAQSELECSPTDWRDALRSCLRLKLVN